MELPLYILYQVAGNLYGADQGDDLDVSLVSMEMQSKVVIYALQFSRQIQSLVKGSRSGLSKSNLVVVGGPGAWTLRAVLQGIYRW